MGAPRGLHVPAGATAPGPIGRLAVRAHFAAARAGRLVELGLDAIKLAAFPDRWADVITATSYARGAAYGSEAHNANGLFEWERAAVERHFPKTGRVLLTSAGGGREARALVERGLSVIATECVASLAEVLAATFADPARGRALYLPPDGVPAELGPFDAAIVGWGGYTHLVGRARRIAFLERLRASLAPGAPLLVSYWEEPEHGRARRWVAALANAVRRPLGRRAVDVGETTAMGDWSRFFGPGEVREELLAAGLEVVVEDGRTFPHTVARRPPR